MIRRIVRSLAVASVAAAILFAASAECRAFCCLFGGCAPRTTYRPIFAGYAAYYPTAAASCCPTTSYYAPSACSPCSTGCGTACATTCNYVPQTSYRTQCVSVPTTTYRPFASCDPCTGATVTAMRPVTTYVNQVQYSPYTTYRPVCTTGCATPATTSYAPASSACCSPVSTAPPVSAPSPLAARTIAPAPFVVAPNPIAAAAPQPLPAYRSIPAAAPNAVPAANDESSHGNTLPRIEREVEGRTTMLPRGATTNVRTAIYNAKSDARVIPAAAISSDAASASIVNASGCAPPSVSR